MQPNRFVVCRMTVKRLLQERVEALKVSVTCPLQFVATTTDCWSARGRSYIGVTAHLIDVDSLERRYVVLFCKRLKGSHTFDVLTTALEDIHAEYAIREKVVKNTADNGSNFVKAFYVDESQSEVEQCVADSVQFEDVSSLLDDDDYAEYRLPSHQRCACHSLNRVYTTDAQHAEDNNVYKKLHHRKMSSDLEQVWPFFTCS